MQPRSPRSRQSALLDEISTITINPAALEGRETRILYHLLASAPSDRQFEPNKIYTITIPDDYNPRRTRDARVKLTRPLSYQNILLLDPHQDMGLMQSNILGGLIRKYLTNEQDFLYTNAIYSITQPELYYSKDTFFLVKLTNTLVRYQPTRFAVETSGASPFPAGGISSVHRIDGRLVLSEAIDIEKSMQPQLRCLFKPKKNPYVIKHTRGTIPQGSRAVNAWQNIRNEYDLTRRFPDFHVKGPARDLGFNSSAFIMRFIDGSDLFDIQKKNQTKPLFTISQLLRLIIMLWEELEKIHLQGIIHRDIKPENIKVKLDSQNNVDAVRIFDFGLSRDQQVSDAGETGGTLEFLAREVMQGKGTTAKSDVFSMGRVIWYLFGSLYLLRLEMKDFATAMNPFDCDSIPELFLSAYCTDTPLTQAERSDIDQFLVRCNRSDPDLRPTARNGNDFFSTLARRKQERITPPPAPELGPRRRKRPHN